MHFYKSSTTAYDNCHSRLLTTSCTAIDYVEKLSEKQTVLSTMPFFFTVAILLASFSLLRLLKSSIPKILDIEKARLSLFKGINLAKRMSTESNDTAARCALALSQLWNSSKAFKKPDGTEYTTLRIRSRLSASPVLDALRWWREEFDPQHRSPTTQGEGLDSNFFFPLRS
jgi:hypothetical protein